MYSVYLKSHVEFTKYFLRLAKITRSRSWEEGGTSTYVISVLIRTNAVSSIPAHSKKDNLDTILCDKVCQ